MRPIWIRRSHLKVATALLALSIIAAILVFNRLG
jgi:hypothetical protein